MAVDVSTTIEVARPRDMVAAFASDPANAKAWYANIQEAEWETDGGLRPGARMRFTAAFLGCTLQYTYEVTEFVPGRRLVMRTAEGPFPMETIYEWADAGGETRMTLRNRGAPAGFNRLMSPIMGVAMRRNNNKDLRRLKELLESGDALE